jgi:hypothetical protein
MHLIAIGVRGKALAELEDGWAALLDEIPIPERVAMRGAHLFEIAAQLLGLSDPRLPAAGRLFALQQSERRGLLPPGRAKEELKCLSGYAFPRLLRPLTALARLAARDAKQSPAVEPEATPARAASLLSHRLFGTVS